MKLWEREKKMPRPPITNGRVFINMAIHKAIIRAFAECVRCE